MKTRLEKFMVKPGHMMARQTVVWYLLGLRPPTDFITWESRRQYLSYLAGYETFINHGKQSSIEVS